MSAGVNPLTSCVGKLGTGMRSSSLSLRSWLSEISSAYTDIKIHLRKCRAGGFPHPNREQHIQQIVQRGHVNAKKAAPIESIRQVSAPWSRSIP